MYYSIDTRSKSYVTLQNKKGRQPRFLFFPFFFRYQICGGAYTRGKESEQRKK